MTEKGMDLSQGQFLREHFTVKFDAPALDLTGRTVLVTGGNAGLGYEGVIHLARNNASRIIIASRNRQTSETKAKEVYNKVPGYKGTIDVETLDLSDFTSVVAFCRNINADDRRLDIVLANAGILNSSFRQTKDGYEQVLQVNALSTGLLATLLLPKLENSAKMPPPAGAQPLKPHLTIVSSEVHYWAKFPHWKMSDPFLVSLNREKDYDSGMERYQVSKLLDIFITREIAKLPAVTNGAVVVNTVNPGFCKSEFRADMGFIMSKMSNWIAWPTELGARNYMYAMVTDTAPGAYVSHCKESYASNFVVSADGQAAQRKFWKECLVLWRGLAPELCVA